MRKESPRRGFTEWLEHIGSVHRANKPAVERALQRLADNDQDAAAPRNIDTRTKQLSSVVTIDRAFDWAAVEDELNRRMDVIGQNGNTGEHYKYTQQ